MIDLEESYYRLEDYGLVIDCDHGWGESFVFKHSGKVFAFSFYEKTGTVSLLEITNDSEYLERSKVA